MTAKPHTRLIILSLSVLIALSGLGLTASHALHHGTDSTAPATAPFDRDCAAASCLMSLPVWIMLSLVIFVPIGRARFQALLPVASIALPRLDPPPRFAA